MEKQYILFGSGVAGESAIQWIGDDQVSFFADNNPSKWGTFVRGKEVISFERLKGIHEDFNVVVTATCLYEDEITEQLKRENIPYVTREAVFQTITGGNERIKKFKDIHKGKRCFIVGNGPSLRMEDLERLHKHNEISFGCNRIYLAFEKTNWRPNYYCVLDGVLLEICKEEIVNLQVPVKFFCDVDTTTVVSLGDKELEAENVYNCFINGDIHLNPKKMTFSNDASKHIGYSATVAYMMIQIAAYMGFEEIFTIGIDDDYKDTPKEREEQNYFSKDYLGEIQKELNKRSNDVGFEQEMLKKAEKLRWVAYEKAEEHSHSHGFRIYNAARGGKLEAFERVDFDGLFGY